MLVRNNLETLGWEDVLMSNLFDSMSTVGCYLPESSLVKAHLHYKNRTGFGLDF